MENLLQNIKSAIAEIKKHPMLSLEKAEIEPPLNPALIDTVEMTSGIYVPEKIKQFYLKANGIHISWKIKPGLDESVMQKIYEQEEEPGYDYKRPLGSLRLLPLEKVLINSWKPPTEKDKGGKEKFSFAGKDYTYASFGAFLKPFDLFHVNNDLQCMAFIADPAATVWQVIMLEDYYADWHQSRITDFETYIQAMCRTWFTVPSRKVLFGKYRGDKEPSLSFSDLPKKKVATASAGIRVSAPNKHSNFDYETQLSPFTPSFGFVHRNFHFEKR